MSDKFGFGQPKGSVVQFAYVVSDLGAEMQNWSDQLDVGPWFLAEGFSGLDPVYRGKPSSAAFDIALTFAGHIQLELIQPKDDQPSVFKEVIEDRGYGFHHFGRAVTNFEEEVAKLVESGSELIFTDKAPPAGNRIAYLSKNKGRPGMIELIEADDGFDQMFTAMFEACRDWDGSEPIRRIGPPAP